MKTNSRQPKRPAEAKTSRIAKRKGDYVQRRVRRMVVTDICVCHLPYQPHPFVIGTIRDAKSETGKSNVWLRNDGQWTPDEASPECYLRIGSWNPPTKSSAPDQRCPYTCPLCRKRLVDVGGYWGCLCNMSDAFKRKYQTPSPVLPNAEVSNPPSNAK